LIRFAIDDQHDILGQILALPRLAATRAKKGDQLRSEDFEHRGERILVGRYPESSARLRTPERTSHL